MITGASRGLGAAIALQLAELGYDIWLNYRSNIDAAHKTEAKILEIGRKCVLLKFDVTDEVQVKEVMQPMLEMHFRFAMMLLQKPPDLLIFPEMDLFQVAVVHL